MSDGRVTKFNREKSAVIPVYILARTPGADPAKTVEWTSICHNKSPWIVVHYKGFTHKSRWATAARKRPFFVNKNGCATDRALSSHATIDAAIKAANKWAKEYA